MIHMKERLIRKTQTGNGFTLAETLLAVLILLLVSTVVATGIPAAKSAYEKVVLASNAEVLLSTTISTLRNELGTAKDIDTEQNQVGAVTHTTITYYNSNRGTASRLYVKSDGIWFQRYYFDNSEYVMDASVVPEAEKLIPPTSATSKLYVTYSGVSESNGIITIDKLTVKHGDGSEDDTVLTKREHLSIRSLSE